MVPLYFNAAQNSEQKFPQIKKDIEKQFSPLYNSFIGEPNFAI